MESALNWDEIFQIYLSIKWTTVSESQIQGLIDDLVDLIFKFLIHTPYFERTNMT